MTSSSQQPFLQVVTTTGSQEEAQRIARSLVEQRLAACVQIHASVQSVYRWEGAVQSATEWLCTIKTSRAKFAATRDAIQNLHSYDVPEIVATEIVDGSEPYLAWIGESLGE